MRRSIGAAWAVTTFTCGAACGEGYEWPVVGGMDGDTVGRQNYCGIGG